MKLREKIDDWKKRITVAIAAREENELPIENRIQRFVELSDKEGLLNFIQKKRVSLDKALSICVWYDDSLQCCEMLLRNGANPNALGYRFAPVHTAAMNGKDMLALMIRFGGNPQLREKDGGTILHCAIGRDCDACVDFAIELGVPIDTPNKEGWTPLYLAIRMGLLSIVKKLIENGAAKSALCKKIAQGKRKKPYLGSDDDYEEIKKIVQA